MNERLYLFERLVEVARTLSAALEIEPLLNSIISAATELTDSQWAAFLLYDEDLQQLRYRTVSWYHREALRSVPVLLDSSLPGSVFRMNEPLVCMDVSKLANMDDLPDSLIGVETRSALLVPVSYKGQAIGVMQVVNKTNGGIFGEDDLLVLNTLASQVALAIRNTELETRSQQAQEQIVQLDRMKSDFIAITSHELRTPLGLILGHSTFLRELVRDEYYEQLDVIVRNAMRLKEIIEDMTKVDNYQTGMAVARRRTFSVRRLLEDLVESALLQAQEKNINLKLKLPANELTIEGDAEKIGVAISNVLQNALVFTPVDGHVLIVAESIPGYVKISVLDSGIGIPSKDLPHIFERFYQVESHLTRKHGGMGLGLSVARQMLELHGGRIWADSIEGKGSQFSLLLPVNAAQAQAATSLLD